MGVVRVAATRLRVPRIIVHRWGRFFEMKHTVRRRRSFYFPGWMRKNKVPHESKAHGMHAVLLRAVRVCTAV